METIKNKENLFWKEYLRDITITNVLSTECSTQDNKFEHIEYEFDSYSTKQIKTFLRENQCSIEVLIYTSWAILLNKYTYNDDIIFGIKLPRDINDAKSKKNILPLRINIKPHSRLNNMLNLVKKSIDSIEEFKDSSINDILEFGKYESIEKLLDSIIKIDDFYSEDLLKLNLELNISMLDNIIIKLEYNSKYFNNSFVSRLITHLVNIIKNIFLYPNRKVDQVEFLEEEERNMILNIFNSTYKDIDKKQTVYHKVEENAVKFSDKVAVKFNNNEVTYRELNNNVNQLARVLLDYGVCKGDFISILLDRSIIMIEYILAIWKVGAAYIPIDKEYPIERIERIVKKSNSKFVISTEEFISNLKSITEDKKIISENLENEKIRKSTDNLDLEFDINDLSYVIYTSGSTGEPKGAMIEHLGMMNHIYSKVDELDINSNSIISQNSSHCFDISVWQFFVSIVMGGTVVVYSNELVIDPEKFLKEIIRDKVTILEVVPTYLTSILDILENENIELKDLKYMLVTGEVVKKKLVEKWFLNYPKIKMVNAYGPTEASDDITHYIMEKVPKEQRILIGKPIQNLNIYIVDTMMNLCPIGAVGQICVAGVGVGRGYLNDEERTKKVFGVDKFNKKENTRLYMTGDLGRWNEDGNIEIFDRIDNQIKVNGFRIEAGEIENAILGYDGISGAVLLIKTAYNDMKYLIAYYTAQKNIDENELKEYLGSILPNYMVPYKFIKLDEFPILTSGKIDRNTLLKQDIDLLSENKFPQSKIELKLEKIWREVLDDYNYRIGINEDFFVIGGNSLYVTKIIAKIHKEFNVKLSVNDFFQNSTIRNLSNKINNSKKIIYEDIPAVNKKEYYELSYYQRRLFFTYCLNPESPVWNMPGRLELFYKNGFKSIQEVVGKVLKSLIERHESLRTRFKLIDGEGVQFIEDDFTIPLKVVDISQYDDNEKIIEREKIFQEEVNTPISLMESLVFRIILINLGNERYDLIFNLHHIISDGWSMELLKDEFFYLFDKIGKNEEVDLPSLDLQYKDFAAWHNKILQDENFKKQAHEYWSEKLKGNIPITKVNLGVNDKIDMNIGKGYFSFINNELNEKIKQLAVKNKTTIFNVLFSTFNLLIAYLTGEKVVLCGTPAAGRAHISTQKIVGFFINPLPIITNIDFDEDFNSFLKRMENEMRTALEHQNYPIELVLDDLKINFPNMNIYLDMLNYKDDERNELLESTKPYYSDIVLHAKYDLYLLVTEYKNGVELFWNFRKALFTEDEIESISTKYIKLLNNICFVN